MTFVARGSVVQAQDAPRWGQPGRHAKATTDS